MAKVEWSQGSTILRAVRIIVRASGRNYRHLARYLLGFAPDGVLWEIFLGVVKGSETVYFEPGYGDRNTVCRLTHKMAAIGSIKWPPAPIFGPIMTS